MFWILRPWSGKLLKLPCVKLAFQLEEAVNRERVKHAAELNNLEEKLKQSFVMVSYAGNNIMSLIEITQRKIRF